MTEGQIQSIKNSMKLSKDELDRPIDNVLGFLPTGMLLIGASLAFLARQSEGSVSISHKWVFFSISLALFLYTLWTKARERRVKTIHTGLPRQKNLEIIEQIAKEQSWQTKTDKSNYKEFLIPFVLGHKGHKLTFVIIENEILFNLRNVGSSRGRMPYLLGIDTIKELRLRTKIKNNLATS